MSSIRPTAHVIVVALVNECYLFVVAEPNEKVGQGRPVMHARGKEE